jgi:hypothetical protein
VSGQLGAILLALLVALPAWAGGPLVLIPFAAGPGSSSQDAERFTRLLSEALAKRALSWTPVRRESSRGPVHAALGVARRLYRARQFTQSRKVLEQALIAQRKAPEGFDAEETAAAWVRIGTIDLRKGSDGKAERAMREAMRIAPGYRPPPGEYPPIVARELERARREVSHGAKAWLTVEGPKGARVEVDGRALGRLPGVRVQLPKGEHHLRLLGADGESFSEWVTLTASTTLPVYFPPTPEHEPLPALTGTQVTAAEVTSLARALEARGAKAAVVGALRGGEPGQLVAQAGLVLASGAGVVLVPSVTFGAGASPAQTAVGVLADSLGQAVNSGGATTPPPVELAPRQSAAAKVPFTSGTGSVAAAGTGHDASPSSGAGGQAGTGPSALATQPTAVPSGGSPGARAVRLTPTHDPGAERSALSPPAGTEAAGGEGSFLSRVPTWVWIAGGVGVAAGAGATVWAVTRNRGPSATVEATW